MKHDGAHKTQAVFQHGLQSKPQSDKKVNKQ